ncbi:MAG: hypothetical protein ACPH4O_07925 [Flavobacteriaceae bacterium]
MDGVVSDKEREVIFRKSKELGVPKDECEIILEGMIEQYKKNSPSSEITTETSSSTSSEEENKSQNDDKREEGELDENGNRIGIWRLFSDDKNWEEGEYDENGNKTGVWKSCFQDKTNLETPYMNGKKHGEVISHMDQEPFVYERYKNDVLVYNRINHPDSNFIMVENKFENGVKSKSKFFDKDGKLTSEDFYDEKGNEVKSISYDNDGDPEWEHTWKNGKIINTVEVGIEKRKNKEKEREKEEEELNKVNRKELLKSISFENITNPKSKLFELLSNEQFKCSYLFYKDEIEIIGGISNTEQLENSILGLKYIVIDRLFTSFFKLLKGDHTIFNVHLYRHHLEWFRTFETRTNYDRPRPGFPNGVPIPYKGYVKLSKDNWGVYIDKNGWYFNPFSDKILFYYGNNVDDYPNTDEYDLDPFYDNPPNFIKGSLFKKPVFVLDNDTVVGIKSNKLCEESEKYYNYWYKFLKTIEQFKKESISNKSSTYKLELENSFEKWNQLETHFDEVNNILKSKESEIQSKEKEFQTNFIQDFIRTLNFIDENIKNSKNLNLRFQGRIERKTYESTEFIEQLNKLIESENIFITTNSSILFGLVDMIRSIIYDDRVRFYQIYEKFDKMRIFNSQYQNDVLNSLNSINDNLVELNSNIETLTNTIDNLGKELISSIRELKFELSYLNDTVSSQLQNISTKLDVNNLLNVVQTYQLWRINSNTKSINKKLNF